MVKLPSRARLILCAAAPRISKDALQQALSAGDLASVILYAEQPDDPEFAEHCQKLVDAVQAHEVAALIADDSQAFGRCGADGLFIETDFKNIGEWTARFSPQKIVGCGGVRDRHHALIAGESNPEFMFFGKLGADQRAAPHPKNLALANWWSEMVEIPCIVQAGNEISSVVECALTGSDFVAVDAAVFSGDHDIAGQVREGNRLLDMHAPDLFEGESE